MPTDKQKRVLMVVGISSSFLPVWRSGGRTELTFWEWVFNHTVWGPPVEYIPEEDYEAAICINRRA